ncbi:MAG: hypothetical protein EA361_02850 [Bacteroidetes bacterium]|nr:MAG: hypothetical protein EA361_02850 [Bacteroidota bacterium]
MTNNKTRITILFIITILLLGCKEDIDFPLQKDFPFVKTMEPIVINKDDVNLIGDLVLPVNFSNSNGEIEFGFIASTPLYTDTIFVGKTDQSQQFNYILQKRYYVDTQLKVQALAKHDSVFYLGGQKRVKITGNNFTITGITPNTGLWQDTVSITGSRLDGYPDKIYVYFYSRSHGHLATVVANDSNYIEVIVPWLTPAKPLYDVSVSTGGNYIWLYDAFAFNEPKITDFHPRQGFQGDTVTIQGNHFGHYHETYTSEFSVTFGEHPLPVVSWNNNEIKVIMEVPTQQENQFTVRHLYYHDTSQNTFNLIKP